MLGVAGINTVTSPFKDWMFLVVVLENVDDLGKSFCVIGETGAS